MLGAIGYVWPVYSDNDNWIDFIANSELNQDHSDSDSDSDKIYLTWIDTGTISG